MTARGRFLVFEGIDGSGKSTQARRVATAWGALGTFEPGDTPAGAALRDVVLDGSVPMSALAEVFVMAADRAQHVTEVVEPALASGLDVVCDRFDGSTIAYQGYGRGADIDGIRAVLAVASAGLVPDLTILLDCPVGVASTRRGSRAKVGDRFEDADGGFLERVRAGFLELAEATASWAVIDATGELSRVSREVDVLVEERFG